MKVTVCFGPVWVVVPCSDGDITIADLTDRAIQRFLKATSGSSTRKIYVQKLIASSDGGFLDPCDRLRDVVDDRDKIIAIFEEHVGTRRQYNFEERAGSRNQCNRGDHGTSVSSHSASSLEILPDDHHVNGNDLDEENIASLNRDIFISSQDLISDSDLIVRRGSEPVMSFNELAFEKNRTLENARKPHGPLKDCLEIDSDSGVSGSDSNDPKSSKHNEVNQIKKLNSPCDVCPTNPLFPRSVVEISDPQTTRQGYDVANNTREKDRNNTKNVAAFSNNRFDEVHCGSGGESVFVLPLNNCSQLMLQNSAASNRTNTRILGKKIFIQLVKGRRGLGFSVTTRDNPAGGDCPIYIKNILPQGAAVENRQLRTGDRLLQVNDIKVTGRSQSEVVSLLRGVAEGSTVDLVISRQDVMDTDMDQMHNFSMDNSEQSEISSGQVTDIPVSRTSPISVGNDPSATSDLDVLVFDIYLNSSDIQGLGITLEGKTVSTSNGLRDHGIFIKSVINGGAAQRDGQLLPGDLLCEVNGECLLNKSNLDAATALRSAICQNSSSPGFARIIVARKKSTASLDSKSNILSKNSKEEIEPAAKFLGGDCFLPRRVKPNGVCASSSYSSHNVSYQQAISDTLLKEILPNPCSISSENEIFSPPSIFSANMDNNTANRENVYQEEYSKFVETNNSSETLDWDCKNSDVTLETSSSDTENRSAFQREGFGRQSMSEKRKTHLDPRNTEVYQRIKRNKVRFCSASLDRSKTKPRQSKEDISFESDTRQSLGKKMSASYESIQAAIQEQDQESRVDLDKDSADNKGHSREISNSFRAAVDRSYENAPENDDISTNECVHGDFSMRYSNDVTCQIENAINSKNSEELQTVRMEKSGSIFKGLGEILRFGRNKKSDGKSEEAEQENIKMIEGKRTQRERIRVSANNIEHQFSENTNKSEPLPVHLDKRENEQLVRSKHLNSSKIETPMNQKYQYLSSSAPSRDPSESTVGPQDSSRNLLHPKSQKLSSPSPSSRLIQLRQEHQRQHLERQRQYPLDAEADRMEQRQRELEQRNQEIKKDMPLVRYRTRCEQPRSRIPYTDRPVSLGNEYQNSDLIRPHLQLHDNNQQRYKLETERQHQQQEQQLQSKNRQQLREQRNSFHEQRQQQQQQQQQESLEQQRQEMLVQQRQQIHRQQQTKQLLTSKSQRPIQHQYSHSYSSPLSNSYISPSNKNETPCHDHHSGALAKRQDNVYSRGSQNWSQTKPFPCNASLDTVALDGRTAFVNYGHIYNDRRNEMILPMHLNRAPSKQFSDLQTKDGYYSDLNSARLPDRTRHYYH